MRPDAILGNISDQVSDTLAMGNVLETIDLDPIVTVDVLRRRVHVGNYTHRGIIVNPLEGKIVEPSVTEQERQESIDILPRVDSLEGTRGSPSNVAPIISGQAQFDQFVMLSYVVRATATHVAIRIVLDPHSNLILECKRLAVKGDVLHKQHCTPFLEYCQPSIGGFSGPVKLTAANAPIGIRGEPIGVPARTRHSPTVTSDDMQPANPAIRRVMNLATIRNENVISSTTIGESDCLHK
jgi:hypothetical protein